MKQSLFLLSLFVLIGAGCSNPFSDQEYTVVQPAEDAAVVVEETEQAGTFEQMREDIDLYINYSPSYGTNILYGYDIESESWIQVNEGDEFYEPVEIVDGTWLAKGVTRDRKGRAKSDGSLLQGTIDSSGSFQETTELLYVPGTLEDYRHISSQKKAYSLSGEPTAWQESIPGRLFEHDLSSSRFTALTDVLEPGIYGGFSIEGVYDNTLYYRSTGGDGGCWWGTLYALDIETKESREVEDVSGCTENVGGKFFHGLNNFLSEPTYFFTEIIEQDGKTFEALVAKTVSGESREWHVEPLGSLDAYTSVEIVALENDDILKDTRVREDGYVSERTIELMHADKNLTTQLYSCSENCPGSRVMTFGKENAYIILPGSDSGVILDLENADVRKTIEWPAEKGYYSYTAVPEN